MDTDLLHKTNLNIYNIKINFLNNKFEVKFFVKSFIDFKSISRICTIIILHSPNKGKIS